MFDLSFLIVGKVIDGLVLHPDNEHIIYPLGTTLVVRHIISRTQQFLRVSIFVGRMRRVPSCNALLPLAATVTCSARSYGQPTTGQCVDFKFFVANKSVQTRQASVKFAAARRENLISNVFFTYRATTTTSLSFK